MEKFIQYPLFIKPVDPFHYNVKATIRSARSEGGVEEHTENRVIDLEKYGITNPFIARGLIGLLDLGIVRNPQHLEAILESSSNDKQLTDTSFEDILYKALPEHADAIGVWSDLSYNMVISSSFLSGYYLHFPLISRTNKYFNFVDELTYLPDKTKALKLLDSFIKTYVSIRRLVYGQTQDAYETKRDKVDLDHSLSETIAIKLGDLDKAYHDVFPNDPDIYGDFDDTYNQIYYTSMPKETTAELENMNDITSCPFSDKGVRRERYRNGDKERVSLETIGTNKSLSNRSGGDESLIVLLRNGTYIRVYQMIGCPFFAFANHQMNI